MRGVDKVLVLAAVLHCIYAFVHTGSGSVVHFQKGHAHRLLSFSQHAHRPFAARKPPPLPALAHAFAAAGSPAFAPLRRFKPRLGAVVYAARDDYDSDYEDEHGGNDYEDEDESESESESDEYDDSESGEDEYLDSDEEYSDQELDDRDMASLHIPGATLAQPDNMDLVLENELAGNEDFYDERGEPLADESQQEMEEDDYPMRAGAEYDDEFDFSDGEYDDAYEYDSEDQIADTHPTSVDPIQRQHDTLQRSGAPLEKYEQLLHTIIDNDQREHVDLVIKLTTQFCQTGKVHPALQGIKFVLAVCSRKEGNVDGHKLPLATMIRWINGLSAHGHGEAIQSLVDKAKSNPSFLPTMLLPGKLAEALSNERPPEEWKAQLDFVIKNITSCFVPDLNVIVRWLGRRHQLSEALQLVEAMVAANMSPDSETYEFVANAAVRSVDKVASVKTMKALPPSRMELPEVIFAGRSNVGKSSLVNMIVNRKALASTSKIPGHTRSFNFYAVNQHSEHVPAVQLVDVPGLGYAHDRPIGDTASWRSMLERFLTVRDSCRVLFHLVDSRVGFAKADADIIDMALRALARRNETALQAFQYVIVLTKADRMSKSRVIATTTAVQHYLSSQRALPEDDLKQIPVLVTSSKSKLGRNDLWRYFLKAFGTADGRNGTTQRAVG